MAIDSLLTGSIMQHSEKVLNFSLETSGSLSSQVRKLSYEGTRRLRKERPSDMRAMQSFLCNDVFYSVSFLPLQLQYGILLSAEISAYPAVNLDDQPSDADSNTTSLGVCVLM